MLMVSSFLLWIIAAAIGFFTLFKSFRFNQENKEVDSSSLSPSSSQSSLSCIWIHDVFPSFCGEDVRKEFFTHVQKEFRRKGITLFNDNEIKRGESIGLELKQAINGSKIAIVLLSRNYASSKWCLDELVEIMKCRENLGQLVVTIFYKVEPSDVKKQSGYFGKVFRKTCKGKTKKDSGRWRQALEKVATIAGYHSKNWDDESVMIEKIAMDISNKLNNSTPACDIDGSIGMRAHLQKMEPLLCLDSDEVRIIGIWGPVGIGKSTIARVLINQLSNSFQLSAFMENIKLNYPRPVCSDDHSLKLHLQQQFMSQIINQKDVEVPHLGVARHRLKDKKVFVVLDGVDQLVQLNAMAKETQWFGPGSRIIITTEDVRVLKAHGINHIYKVDFPRTNEALEIFCMNAFGQKSPCDGFEVLSREVTSLAGRLPLGLKVMGSYFRGMSKKEWEKALPRLRTSLGNKIKSILKFSYDALDDEDQDLFLYIACFFNHQEIEKVEEHLAKRFLDVRQGLQVLAEKSFISMNLGRIEMHNLLARLGREIGGKRNFVVDAREICEVLNDDTTGSKSVTCIEFNLSKIEDVLNISEGAFERLSSNLQFLRISGDCDRLYLLGTLNYQFQKLRLLDWVHCPMTCLPSIFSLNFLVELNMRGSKLEKLWEGIQPLRNLKWMDLSCSKNLKELPDLSTATNLQELDVSGCSSLVNLPSSIGNATKLKKLILKHCSSLVELPFSIGSATSLQKLDMINCWSLVELPSSIGNVTNLKDLDLSGCSKLKELPSSICNGTNLHELDLSNCSSLVKLPSIKNVTNLKRLNLTGCSSLEELPFSVENTSNLRGLNLVNCSSLVEIHSSVGIATKIEILNLTRCSILEEPSSSIWNVANLHNVYLIRCTSLVEVPSCIGSLKKLSKLSLQGCTKLEVLPMDVNLESLYELDLSDCSLLKSFPEISTSLKYLKLNGTAIEELPSSIKRWSRLYELHMSYSENIKKTPLSVDSITVLHFSDTEIREVSPWVKKISHLRGLVLKECSKLVSLPQLPDSLSYLDAENCDSLERLDCFFHNPEICLNFANCFKLDQKARDLIIQTSTRGVVVLPGREVPTYFTHRATGGSLTVKLNKRPLTRSLRFKVCISLVNKGDDKAFDRNMMHVYYRIMDKQKDLIVWYKPNFYLLYPSVTEHLYIFEVEAELTSSELIFEFKVDRDKWEIGECGLLQLLGVLRGCESSHS